jgi:hypothetical protein
VTASLAERRPPPKSGGVRRRLGAPTAAPAKPALLAAGGAAWAVAHLPWPSLLQVVAGIVAGVVGWLVPVVLRNRRLADALLSSLRRINAARFRARAG